MSIPIVTITPELRRSNKVRQRGRVHAIHLLQLAANAVPSSTQWSTDLEVGQYFELLIMASLLTASSGSPAAFTLSVATYEPVLFNAQRATSVTPTPVALGGTAGPFANRAAAGVYDVGSVTLTDPGTAAGTICGLKVTNFGSKISIGVAATTAWGSASLISISVQGKG